MPFLKLKSVVLFLKILVSLVLSQNLKKIFSFQIVKVLQSDEYGSNAMETDLHIESFYPKFAVLLNTQENLEVLKQKIFNSVKSNTLQAAKLSEQVLELDRLGNVSL